jgi:predicted  nucleic acid-binding Zn-ribbon protein
VAGEAKMGELEIKLDDLLSRKKKPGPEVLAGITDDLCQLFKSTQDAAKLADYLLCFHADVTSHFFEKSSDEIKSDDIHKIIDSLLVQQSVLKINVESFWSRVCCLISIYLNKKSIPVSVFNLLKTSLKKIESKKGFSKQSVNTFKNKIPAILENTQFLENLPSWKESELMTLLKFLNNAKDCGCFTEEYLLKWSETNGFTKYIPTQDQILAKQKIEEKKLLNNLQSLAIEQILQVISDKVSNIQNEKTKMENVNKSLQQQVESKNDEILKYTQRLKEKTRELTDLNQEITEKKAALETAHKESQTLHGQILEFQNKVQKQNEDIKNFTNTHEGAIHDEINSLKSKIAKDISNAFTIFTANNPKPSSVDLCEIYKSCLSNLFRTLKRNGINPVL